MSTLLESIAVAEASGELLKSSAENIRSLLSKSPLSLIHISEPTRPY